MPFGEVSDIFIQSHTSGIIFSSPIKSGAHGWRNNPPSHRSYGEVKGEFMIDIHLKDLLEAGCHFGHEVKRWHPKAKKYIYTARDNIHIIDLGKTREGLLEAANFAKNLGVKGKKLLFVGTKRQARLIIESEAKRVSAPYFDKRWIGGFVTNWTEIKKSIDKLNKMQQDKESGAWGKFVKHEQLLLERKRALLEKFYGGVKTLKELPDALFVVDIKKESAAVAEADSRSIPIIAIVDTNTDPTKIDYPIPANDDSVKSISLIVKYIADAYDEGLQEFKKSSQAQSSAARKETKKEEIETPAKKEKKVKKTTKKVKKISTVEPKQKEVK